MYITTLTVILRRGKTQCPMIENLLINNYTAIWYSIMQLLINYAFEEFSGVIIYHIVLQFKNYIQICECNMNLKYLFILYRK